MPATVSVQDLAKASLTIVDPSSELRADIY